MDLIAPIAKLTQRLPRRIGASLGWRIGQRASRVNRVAHLAIGGQLVVDIGDYVHRPMYFLGEYEPPTTRLFQTLATPGWTVLDIGANVGYFSVIAGVLGGPGSQVVAFEPNPRLADMLAQSIILNPSLSIDLERLGVADRLGELPLHLSSQSRNSGLSSLRADLPDRDGEVITVPLTTVDDYCASRNLHPDLIKIDVEGFELQVLRGAATTLAAHTPSVICEITPQRDDPQAIIDLVSGHGYTPYAIDDDGILRPLHLRATALFENICFRTERPS